MKIRYILLLAVLLVWGCEPVDVTGARQTTSDTTSAQLPPVVEEILVAKERIEKGTELTDELVETAEIGKRYLTPDMLTGAMRGNVTGRVAEHAIPKGALLHDRDFQGTQVAAPEDTPVLEPIVVAEAEAPRREVPGKAMAALLAKGNEAYFGTLTIEPGAGVPQHRDPTEEFLYVVEGGGTLTIDGTSHEITVGMGIFMPANAEVSFQNGDKRTRVVQAFGGPGPAAKYDAWSAVEVAEE